MELLIGIAIGGVISWLAFERPAFATKFWQWLGTKIHAANR